MYCPQCGQQQISDNTRFCSRCGLLVSGLADWLSRGGILPGARDEEVVIRKRTSAKRKGITRGAKLMFLSGVLLPMFLGLSIAFDSPGPLFLPFTVFLAGISVLLYSVLFGDDTPLPLNPAPQPSRLATMFGRSALPPATHNGIDSVIDRPVRTSELVGRPSVTEHTTKLLDRD